MATLTNLTFQQNEALDPLMRSAQSYVRKINDVKRRLANDPAMDYDKTKRLKNQLYSLEGKYHVISEQINKIMNARSEYEEKLNTCRRLLKEADEMKKTWGF